MSIGNIPGFQLCQCELQDSPGWHRPISAGSMFSSEKAMCILYPVVRLIIFSWKISILITVCEPSSLKAEKTLKKPSGVLLRHFVPDQQKTTLISNLNMSTLCDPLSKGLARCSPRFL